MKKAFAVIGLGRLGVSILRHLSELTTNIIAIDRDESRVAIASKFTEKCFVADATKKTVLQDLGVRGSGVDHAIIAIGDNLSATILTLINLKELGVKKVTVRVDEDDKGDILKRLGADEVIDPESDIGETFAKQAISDSLVDFYPIDDNYAIVQVSVPYEFEALTLIELDLRNKYGVNVVGILREGKFFIPKANDLIDGGDILMIVGNNKQIKKVDGMLNKKKK